MTIVYKVYHKSKDKWFARGAARFRLIRDSRQADTFSFDEAIQLARKDDIELYPYRNLSDVTQ